MLYKNEYYTILEGTQSSSFQAEIRLLVLPIPQVNLMLNISKSVRCSMSSSIDIGLANALNK